MDRILEKVSKKVKLTNREERFLELYNHKEEFLDFMYISKNVVFSKVSTLLDKKKRVICDLHDKDGRIGIEIVGLHNDVEKETCVLDLRDGTSHSLHDRFLYNLIYNIKKDEYSLQEQDEYFEKIEASND